MFCDHARQERAIDSARHIVPSGYRKKRPGVVIETDRVVEAGSLRRTFAKPHHPFRTVMKPPCRTQPQAGIVSGKRSQFAAVSRFVESEQNDREAWLVAETIQQGA